MGSVSNWTDHVLVHNTEFKQKYFGSLNKKEASGLPDASLFWWNAGYGM